MSGFKGGGKAMKNPKSTGKLPGGGAKGGPSGVGLPMKGMPLSKAVVAPKGPKPKAK